MSSADRINHPFEFRMNSADKLKIREIGVGFKNRTSFKNTGTAFPLTNSGDAVLGEVQKD